MKDVDNDLIRQQFLDNVPKYRSLEEEARFIIGQALDGTDIKIYAIPSRVKTIQSFLDKMKRKDSKKPFEEIQDIVGLRIVCLFISDISRISDILKEYFYIISEDNKIDQTESSFGYLSVHFIVKLKDNCSGPRYDSIIGLPFEIQVRTLAMDAWANISHYLDYKSELDIPKELKRDFYALSGLFYVADKHFEMFFKSRERNTRRLEELEIMPDQEINLDSFTVYLNKRLPDREHSSPDAVSEMVSELKEFGYTTIGDIERILYSTQDAFPLYEEDYPPTDSENNEIKYADVGVIRSSLKIFDNNYRQKYGSTDDINKYKKLLKY